MSYDLKTLASRIKGVPSGYYFIVTGLVEIYNIIHSIPNFPNEPRVIISISDDIYLNSSAVYEYGVPILKDAILNCRNTLKSLVKNRLKYIVKNDSQTSSNQVNEYSGNEAYNISKNTVKGNNIVRSTQYSNTEYQDNQYLISTVNKYITDFTCYISFVINNHILKRRVYKL